MQRHSVQRDSIIYTENVSTSAHITHLQYNHTMYRNHPVSTLPLVFIYKIQFKLKTIPKRKSYKADILQHRKSVHNHMRFFFAFCMSFDNDIT